MEIIKNVMLEKIVNVVEPPVRNHLKCIELEVICGRWVATRVKLQGIFYEEKCGHIYFLKRIYCMQFLGFNIGKSTLFLKFLLILLDASTFIQRTHRSDHCINVVA